MNDFLIQKVFHPKKKKHIIMICNWRKKILLQLREKGKIKLAQPSNMFLLSNIQYQFLRNIRLCKLEFNKYYSLNSLMKKI